MLAVRDWCPTSQQPHARLVADHGRLDHDIGKVFGNAQIPLEDLLHHLLILSNAFYDKFEQIIEAATDQMALDQLVIFPDALLEPDEVVTAMIAKSNRSEDDLNRAQLRQIDDRTVTRNIARFFQPLDTRQARTGGKPNQLRQLGVGDPPILLQFGEYIDVDPIEFRQIGHGCITYSNQSHLTIARPFPMPLGKHRQ